MIAFKKRVGALLPYDRNKYCYYLTHDNNLTIKWYGVSFQLKTEREKQSLSEYLEVFEPFFRQIILKFDTGFPWIINHDGRDLPLFPNNRKNLPKLRGLCKQSNLPSDFKGALILSKNDLLECAKDIISYPHLILAKKGYLYSDLDISHKEMPLIIKVTGHFTIDILSMDNEVLKEVVNGNHACDFLVKGYRGTSLLQ